MARRTFAVASVLLLIAVAAIAIDNYDREWRAWQRRYYAELEHQEDGSVTILDRLRIESQLGLNRVKIVTEGGRIADMCMTCHINAALSSFEENPLKPLNEIHRDIPVFQEATFQQLGCTSCHGGKPLALNSEEAHTFMVDRYDDVFLMSLEELGSPKQMVRQEAIEEIRWLTGSDFGFSFSAPPQERQEAIERIREWWRLHRDTFITEGYGDRRSPFRLENPRAEEIEKLTHVSRAGQPLDFVGSSTCLGCHGNPNPKGAPYIPPSNREHVERWFREEFRTRENTEIYLLDHPFLAQTLIAQEVEDPDLRSELFDLLKRARRTGELPEPGEMDELMELMRAKDLTCEACHGPGSQYAKLMMKGLSLHYQGRESEAAEMLKTAGRIARENAQRNVNDSRVWGIFERLIARASASAAQTPSVEMGE